MNGQLGSRKDEYYRAELSLDNSASALYASITNIASRLGREKWLSKAVAQTARQLEI